MLIKYRPTDWFGLAPLANFADDSFFAPLGTLRREMDRLFSGYENSLGLSGSSTAHALTDVSLEDRGESLVLTAALPGLSDKDLDLSITGDSVVLRAERKLSEPEGYSCHLRERGSFSMHRAYRLPVRVNAEKAEATLKDGMLTVTLPKAADAQPRAITVKSS